jgi:hypothetical protein
MSGTQVIVDRSRRGRGCLGIGCGTVFGGFGVAFLVGVVAAIFADGLASPTHGGFGGFLVAQFMLGIGSVFVAGGGAALFFGVRSLWLGHVLGVPTLVVPSAPPLCLGAVVVARFGRSGGSRQVAGTPQLTAELICHESTTYRQGTDDHTATREVYRRDLAVQVDPAPGTVAGRIAIAVPLDVPPSMRLSHNRIKWSVKVLVQVPGLPDDSGTFAVWVQPVVAGPVAAREPGGPW